MTGAATRRGGPQRVWLAVAPAAFLGVLFFIPLFRTLALAFAPGAADDWAWIARPYAAGRIRSAFVQALLSVALTLAVAVPLALFHHRNALPWTRAQLAIHAAPFVLPVFVVVFGIQGVFGARGLTATFLGVDVLATVGPLGAVALAHAYYNYGFAARLLATALERRPHALEDVARTLGAPPWQATLRTTARLLAPQAAAVAVLVFLFSFSSFGVVLYLGGGSVATLETLLYENLRGAFARHDRAAVLATLQLAANALVLVAYAWLLRRQAPIPAAAPRPRPARTSKRVLAWTFTGLATIPAATVLAGSFRIRGDWTLSAWHALVDAGHPGHRAGFDLLHASTMSLTYATATMLLSLALAGSLAYALRGMTGPARVAIDAATAIPLGTSSLLIGFGYLLTFGVAWFAQPATARLLIVAAHTLVAFPFVARVLVPTVAQHDARLDDAARSLGAPPASVLARIHWPLLRRPVQVAAGFAAALSLGDFGASLLLMNERNRGLSVWIDALGATTSFDPLMRAQATAIAAILLVLTAAAYVLVEQSETHRDARQHRAGAPPAPLAGVAGEGLP